MSDPAGPHADTNTIGSWYPPATPVSSGPVLVATDGTVAAGPAFSAAFLIAAKSSSRVQVLVVVEPLPVLVPPPSVLMQPLVASPELLDAERDRVVSHLRESAPPELHWQVDVEYGRPGAEIVNKARDLSAQLIVMALVHHGIVDRILDGDTALEVMRQSPAPVLLASSSWKALPTRAVFSVDFSAQSMQAARAGLRLLADGAIIALVHVRPMATLFDGGTTWEEEYEKMSVRELAKFAEALNAPAGMRVEQVLLAGRPSAELLRYADRTEADLIVSGTHGTGFMQRLLLGSVATRLMRHSMRSLLVVPGAKE